MYRKLINAALYLAIFPGTLLLVELLHLRSLPRYQTLAVGAIIAGGLGSLAVVVARNWVATDVS